jgi:pimeloyl-ACP methyl ester carboxylesterase
VNRASLGRAHKTLDRTFDHDLAGHRGGLGGLVFGGRAPGLAANVRVPVGALHGTDDRSAPVGRVEDLAERVGWRLRVEKGENHQVLLERPGLVAEWILGEVTDLALGRTQAARRG